ncbi:MAG TPA: hypothetical protein V6D08_20140 [Candidatus Obscuribacterales bacterium]
MHDYGHVTWQPPGVTDASLGWQIVNWLEGGPEWNVFQRLLSTTGEIDREDLRLLYPALIRIPIEFITECAVAPHPTFGPTLVVRYTYPEEGPCGIVLYAVSSTGENDLHMISYEGQQPSFSRYLNEAAASMSSIRRV